MDVNQHYRFTVPDRSFASLTKKDITRLAESFALSEAAVGKVNIIVSEMLTNLEKFSPEGGELLVKAIGKPIKGIEIICLDNGSGMSDPARMMEDGVSTYGSAGEGLGAIKRQSDVFDLYSYPQVGTVIVTQVYKSGSVPRLSSHRYEVGSVMVSKPKEVDCGDGFAVIHRENGVYLLALDGLGHGTNAKDVAQLGVKTFCDHPQSDPAEALRTIHGNIRRTRGAVGFVAFIDTYQHQLNYCGIGNIAGKMFSMEGGIGNVPYKSVISYNGILGHNVPGTFNNQQLEWSRNKILIVHSDGLKSRWDLNKYPNLQRHMATTIAAVLYKDHSRHTDDTLVLVCKAKI
ncbi:SpoIIE family protein phosphatase [Pontibacter sp. JH31]|uniref:SpoIIE family protein phosphatase n=1 Tax=Pontibacter aquaedesilientis TaxID=2766980 RepID=A0ABR7XK27_9BACT|nr:SpoIIE family protein phosphatase [Pontibacter aquaedesilientis]MBD1398662.1 SpoIIE family protein phosphatase [Pontibacter aquaedesilientis]